MFHSVRKTTIIRISNGAMLIPSKLRTNVETKCNYFLHAVKEQRAKKKITLTINFKVPTFLFRPVRTEELEKNRYHWE